MALTPFSIPCFINFQLNRLFQYPFLNDDHGRIPVKGRHDQLWFSHITITNALFSLLRKLKKLARSISIIKIRLLILAEIIEEESNHWHILTSQSPAPAPPPQIVMWIEEPHPANVDGFCLEISLVIIVLFAGEYWDYQRWDYQPQELETVMKHNWTSLQLECFRDRKNVDGITEARW